MKIIDAEPKRNKLPALTADCACAAIKTSDRGPKVTRDNDCACATGPAESGDSPAATFDAERLDLAAAAILFTSLTQE